MTNTPRAIVYVRYSSDNQRAESNVAQLRAAREHAQRQGYVILEEFADEERTATTDARPQFLRMVRAITSGRLQADVLLVHKLDRFARNRYDAAFYRRELRRAGCRLESILEPLDDSPESIILESLLDGMAEYYSANLGREVRKGMTETALQGKHTGGRPPLGYAVAEGRYVIQEDAAAIVRQIFARYVAGANYGEIIAELDVAGARTRDGKPFTKTSLHSILTNRKYIGVYVFRRTVSAQGRRNIPAARAGAAPIELPDALPAIIDADTWAAVQARLAAAATRHGAAGGAARAKVIYLLSGLVTCGHCGARVVGMSTSYKTRVSKQDRPRHVYLCPTSRKPATAARDSVEQKGPRASCPQTGPKGRQPLATGETPAGTTPARQQEARTPTYAPEPSPPQRQSENHMDPPARSAHACPCKRIAKDELEAVVLQHMQRHLFSPAAVRALARAIVAHANKRRTASTSEDKQHQAALRQIERKTANLVNAIADGAPAGPLTTELHRLETEKATLLARLDESRRLQTTTITEPLITALLQQKAEHFKTATPAEQRALLLEFHPTITLTNTAIDITLHLTTEDTDGGGGPTFPAYTVRQAYNRAGSSIIQRSSSRT